MSATRPGARRRSDHRLVVDIEDALLALLALDDPNDPTAAPRALAPENEA